jgi:hypothetical protein
MALKVIYGVNTSARPDDDLPAESGMRSDSSHVAVCEWIRVEEAIPGWPAGPGLHLLAKLLATTMICVLVCDEHSSDRTSIQQLASHCRRHRSTNNRVLLYLAWSNVHPLRRVERVLA